MVRSSGSSNSGSVRFRSRSRSPNPTCTCSGRPCSAAACTPKAMSTGLSTRKSLPCARIAVALSTTVTSVGRDQSMSKSGAVGDDRLGADDLLRVRRLLQRRPERLGEVDGVGAGFEQVLGEPLEAQDRRRGPAAQIGHLLRGGEQVTLETGVHHPARDTGPRQHRGGQLVGAEFASACPVVVGGRMRGQPQNRCAPTPDRRARAESRTSS